MMMAFFFNTYHNDADMHRMSTHPLDSIVYVKPQSSSNLYMAAKVIGIPNRDTDIYTLQHLRSNQIFDMPEHCIMTHNPNATPHNVLKNRDKTFPSWIKTNAPATLFTDRMVKPRRGTLILHQDNEWYFHPGRGMSRTPLLLPDLNEHCLHFIKSGQLTQGHPPFHTIFNLIRQQKFEQSVARHVSAANLQHMDAPTLMKMSSLQNHDKDIWKEAYDEEYYGLYNLPAWTSISESEYQKIRHIVGSALPTMALSTIKYDENGKPKRAKWRIVALGNLDPHAWTTNDCFAPVMSMVELRFLVSLAIHHRRPLRSGDIKQAFCQASLPPNEQYVL